jgi:hypothetical protein
MSNLWVSSAATSRKKYGSVCLAVTAPAHSRSVKGVFMKTYYQVDVNFSLSHGKPSLVNMSLNSTSEYYPFPVWTTGSPLFLSRFFNSVP